MASRPTSRLNAGQTGHPRRNLFSSSALRRPPTSSTNAAAPTMDTPVANNHHDMLVRKEDGSYITMTPSVSAGEGDNTIEDEEEDSQARIADLLKNRRSSNEPELLEALLARLQKHTGDLDADKWIFEREDGRS